jgi:transposase
MVNSSDQTRENLLMANRIKMVQKELLFALFSQNLSGRKINTLTGLHRLTIRRYRKEWQRRRAEKELDPTAVNLLCDPGKLCPDTCRSVPPRENEVPTEGVVHFQVPTDPKGTGQKTASKSKASAYHEIIHRKLYRGQHARSIYQDLVDEEHFSGSYDSVKRYIRKVTHRTPVLYARMETPPGEEAQVDFGEGAPVLVNGKYRKPWLFVMTLSHSRKSYQECVWKQDVETFIHCHENAFTFFGGVTRMVKHDNLKSAVLKAHLYESELNPTYLAFADHCGFIPIPCKVRTPEHKGKVESHIKYVQNNALKGKTFAALDEQNQYLTVWNKTWASTRIHGTTKKQVNLMFSQEQPLLRPLPETPFQVFKIGHRKVSITDSHIEVQGAYYPVPPQYMGKKVQVHYNSRWVKVFYREELIQYLSTIEKGRFHPDRSCLPPNKDWPQRNYIDYLFRRCAMMGASVLEWAQLARHHRQERAYRSIQGVVALSTKYAFGIINAACRQSIDQQVFSYHLVKDLAEAIRLQRLVQKEIYFTQESPYIRPPKTYQDLLRGETHG